MAPQVKFSLASIKAKINKHADPTRATGALRFFKTKKGEYGYGDTFIGLTNPECHHLAKIYQDLPLSLIESLLQSSVHEHRLVALLIMVDQFKKVDQAMQQEVFDLYLNSTKYINNWDLVDSSADKIVGAHLVDQDKQVLYQLAHSSLLWDRRIAIIAALAFIKRGQPDTTFAITKILLNDQHDLIHKAVGWMLREVGKSCGQDIEEQFLKQIYHQMPRTMLRYAIEHFPEALRKRYLHGTV